MTAGVSAYHVAQFHSVAGCTAEQLFELADHVCLVAVAELCRKRGPVWLFSESAQQMLEAHDP